MKYYYNKDKNLIGFIPYLKVKDELWDTADQCISFARRKYDGNRLTGYVYILEQLKPSGENINHGYKSTLPFKVVGYVPVSEIQR